LIGATALAGGVLAGFAEPALAQDQAVQTASAGSAGPVDPREARIEQLEAEIHELAAEVADLKASEANNIKAVREDQTAMQKSLPQVTFPAGRPTIASADGSFKASLRTIVQLDAAHYSVSPNTPSTDLSSGTNFRRARLGIDATVYKDWNVSIWGDFGGSGVETPVLNQAWVEYAGWHPFHLAAPVRLRVGAWSTPTGLEDATPTAELPFLERPAVAELVRGFAGGDGRSSVGYFANGAHWYVSGTLTGDVAGAPSVPEFGEQEGFLSRIAFNPLSGKDYDLHIGANVSGVLKPPDTAAGPAVAEAVRLRIQPEIRVDDNNTRLIDTGSISADQLIAWGLEGGLSFHSLFVDGEWYKIHVSRTSVGALPSPFDPSFEGWYVQGSWALTGERRKWTPASGGFRGIIPANNFNPSKGTWGAWEIAGRYSWLSLDEHLGLAGGAPPLGGIRGGTQKITTIGLNWYPNPVVRFLLDYQWIRTDRLNAVGGDIGESVDVVSVRSQFAF
jgi:phosphate-selective porin OprO/OprP